MRGFTFPLLVVLAFALSPLALLPLATESPLPKTGSLAATIRATHSSPARVRFCRARTTTLRRMEECLRNV